jgi:hypothetical protein
VVDVDHRRTAHLLGLVTVVAPGTVLFNWTVDSSSSGVFLNATGGGTDVVEAAGEAAKGVISGTLNLS